MTSHDVRDMLDLPGTAGPRPAKKQRVAAPKSNLKGLAREVQSLGGDNPIAIVPEISIFKKRRLAIRKPAAKWEFKPFKNSAREDDLVLRHWRKKIEAPPAAVGEDGTSAQPEPIVEPVIDDSVFAKFNVRVNIPTYDDDLYKTHLESEDWSKDETDYLMAMAQEYDLRWPIIWDRYEYEPPVSQAEDANVAMIPIAKARTLEELKDRYYKAAAELMKARKPLETMDAAEFDLYEKMKNFSAKQETYRKKYAENAFHRTKDEAKEEESLLLELKRILVRSEKMSEERKELYTRLEAPPSTGNIGVYTTSQGLGQLFQQLATLSKSRNPRRSIMGPEGVSPSGTSGALQQSGFDRRDSTARESISGPGGSHGKKGTAQGPSEHRQLTEEEERLYGVAHFTDRSASGPVFRWEKLNKPISTKSSAQQAKIINTLQELGIPTRLIMPTADVGAAWTNLLDGITRMLDMRKAVDKAAGELALAQAYKAEKEKKERAARGEPEPESEQGGAVEGQNGDVKIEDGARDSSAHANTRSGSVHKRSASVLSSVSDKSTKRQRK